MAMIRNRVPRRPLRAALCMGRTEEPEEMIQLLKEAGWLVTAFSEEQEFVLSHFSDPYAAVFVLLPGVAGQELAVRARERSSDCALIWGSNDPGFARSAYRLLATDFFQYPCGKERLQEAIQRCEATM